MAKPQVIILDSNKARTRHIGTSIASAYAQSEHNKRCVITDFYSCIDENVNRMFGLPLSTEAYKDVLDEATEDFFGYSPSDVYHFVRDAISSKFGLAFYGRNLARRLHRDNISNLYLVNGMCYPESILAVAHEVGIKNICVINLQSDGDEQPYDQSGYTNNAILNNIRVFNLPLLGDYNMQRMIVQGAVKAFLES